MSIEKLLADVQSVGMAHNGGARGQYILVGTEAQLAALESRIRADEREKFAKLINDTVRPGVDPWSALEHIAAAIRNSAGSAPVGEG